MLSINNVVRSTATMAAIGGAIGAIYGTTRLSKISNEFITELCQAQLNQADPFIRNSDSESAAFLSACKLTLPYGVVGGPFLLAIFTMAVISGGIKTLDRCGIHLNFNG